MPDKKKKQMANTTENRQPMVLSVTLKATIVHTITYFLVGSIAFILLSYPTWYGPSPLSWYLRHFNDVPAITGLMARGIIFGLVFYLLKDSLFGKKNGWLVLWALLIGVGMLSSFGLSPVSIEGMIYLYLPIGKHLREYPEIILQSLLLSVIVTYWVNHPEKRWISWVLGILFSLLILTLTMELMIIA